MILALLLALGCSGGRAVSEPPPEPAAESAAPSEEAAETTPAVEDTFAACVATCMREATARPVSAEQTRADCEAACGTGDTVATAADLDLKLGQRVEAVGTYQPVDDPPGAALTLADGQRIWLTAEGGLPASWEPHLDGPVRVSGTLVEGAAPYDGPWLVDLGEPTAPEE